MAGGRRRFLAGLLLGAVPLAAAEAAPAEDLLVQAQYGYGGPPLPPPAPLLDRAAAGRLLRPLRPPAAARRGPRGLPLKRAA